MVDLVFDVLGTPDAAHYFFSGGFDGVFLFFKFTPKPGFDLVKVTHGVHVLWERTGHHLLSLTLHKLGNLPVALLLHFDGSDLFFLFDNLEWKPVTKFAYEHKLHGPHHHLDLVDHVLDVANANPEDVVAVPVKLDNHLSVLFSPGLGKVFVEVKESANVLWKAAKPGDKCLSASVHSLNGVVDVARLLVVEGGHALEKCLEKVGGKWVPLGLHAYLAKKAFKPLGVTCVNLSGEKLCTHVFAVRGERLGLPFDLFFANLLAGFVKVFDGDQALWVAEPGHYGLHVTLSHDGLHAHLLVATPNGLEDVGFVKKDGKWAPVVGDAFPAKFKLLAAL